MLVFTSWKANLVNANQLAFPFTFQTLGYSRNDIPQPEYPRSWVWLVPLIWLVAAILVALVLLPKREFLDESETTPSR